MVLPCFQRIKAQIEVKIEFFIHTDSSCQRGQNVLLINSDRGATSKTASKQELSVLAVVQDSGRVWKTDHHKIW